MALLRTPLTQGAAGIPTRTAVRPVPLIGASEEAPQPADPRMSFRPSRSSRFLAFWVSLTSDKK